MLGFEFEISDGHDTLSSQAKGSNATFSLSYLWPVRHFTYVRNKLNLVLLACEDGEYLGRWVEGGSKVRVLGWLVGCFGLNGRPFETVFQSISGRLPERQKEMRNDRQEEKCQNNSQPHQLQVQ